MVSSPSSLEEKLAKPLLTYLTWFLQDVHVGSQGLKSVLHVSCLGGEAEELLCDWGGHAWL